MAKNILVIAAHPDDETLGAGATLLRHQAGGDKLSWLIMTRMTEEMGYSPKKIQSREKEIARVARMYGFKSVGKLDLPSTGLDSLPFSDVVQQVASFIKKTKAQIIYFPHGGDVHSDHRVTYGAVMAAAKSFRTPSVERLLTYETVSETEFAYAQEGNNFLPTVFVDVEGYLDKKIAIMKQYKGEMAAFPFPRSEKNLRALAAFRGATMGAHAAEAFMLAREFVGKHHR